VALRVAVGIADGNSASDRVNALVVLVPLAYKTRCFAEFSEAFGTLGGSHADAIDWFRLFLFWVRASCCLAIQLSIRVGYAASSNEPAGAEERVSASTPMMDRILPVSARAAGLRSDSGNGN
jgi:hypothetical protein